MPRETVYGEQVAFDPEDQNPAVPVVDVMWSREGGFVQIVTKATDAHGGRWAGEREGDDPSETHFTDGMHVDLGRKEINNLIRHLRRARDQAFGRDE